MSFTESAYKEFEKFDLNKNNVPTIATDRTEVESPEPQERDTTLLKLLALKRFTEDRIKNLIYFDEDKQAWSEDQKTTPSESHEEPCLFADWLIKNGWEPQMTEGCWIQYAEEPIMKNTTELYQHFKLTRNP